MGGLWLFYPQYTRCGTQMQQFHNAELNKTYELKKHHETNSYNECQTSYRLVSLGKQRCFDNVVPWGLSQAFDPNTAKQLPRISVFDVL